MPKTIVLGLLLRTHSRVVEPGWSRDRGHWGPLSPCVFEARTLQSSKKRFVCTCQPGTWTPAVGANATRWSAMACAPFRGLHIHIIGDSIVEQGTGSIDHRYSSFCDAQIDHNIVNRHSSCSFVNFDAFDPAKYGSACLARELATVGRKRTVVVLTSGAAHTVHSAPLVGPYAEVLGKLKDCVACDRAALAALLDRFARNGTVVDTSQTTPFYAKAEAYVAEIAGAVERARVAGVVLLDAPPAGAHCENESTWRWHNQGEQEAFRYAQYAYAWQGMDAVNQIFSRVMEKRFAASPVPFAYVGGYDALAARRRAHTGNFALVKDAAKKPMEFGTAPDCLHWCAGPLELWPDLILGALRAFSAEGSGGLDEADRGKRRSLQTARHRPAARHPVRIRTPRTHVERKKNGVWWNTFLNASASSPTSALEARVSPAQHLLLRSLFEKLERGEEAVMLVLGGSMLAGIGCTPGSWTCAYPSRLAKLWPTLEGRHAPKLRVISRARGGTTTASTLPFLEYLIALDESGPAPDLILVDFSVNDARESQDWTVDIDTEAAAAASFTRGDRVFAATESFLRFALRKGSSALLVVESQYYEEESLDAHRAAAGLYGVPFLAYGDGLVPPIVDAVAWGPSNSAVINWAHPPAATHQRIAVATVAYIARLAHALRGRSVENDRDDRLFQGRLDAPPLAPPRLANTFRVCDAALSTYDAKRAGAANLTSEGPRVLRGKWVLAEDRPGKPGWISTTPGSIASFHVRFGPSPRLVVVYTRSYQTFGDVLLSVPGYKRIGVKGPLKGKEEMEVLHGCCNADKVTQSELRVVNVAQFFKVPPNISADISLLFQGAKNTKVVLSLISSC